MQLVPHTIFYLQQLTTTLIGTKTQKLMQEESVGKEQWI